METITSDSFATEADKIAAKLTEESAAHFTVAEIMWLMTFLNKMRWGTSEKQEQVYLDAVSALRDRVAERKQQSR